MNEIYELFSNEALGFISFGILQRIIYIYIYVYIIFLYAQLVSYTLQKAPPIEQHSRKRRSTAIALMNFAKLCFVS
jgi:hypothetical protein